MPGARKNYSAAFGTLLVYMDSVDQRYPGYHPGVRHVASMSVAKRARLLLAAMRRRVEAPGARDEQRRELAEQVRLMAAAGIPTEDA
jgi:hypothetical protein